LGEPGKKLQLKATLHGMTGSVTYEDCSSTLPLRGD